MDLKLLSYNSTGFDDGKVEFIKFVTYSLGTDILFLQEHFQLQANAFKIQNAFKDFNSLILPATKNNKTINCGRPSGGLSILWRSALNSQIKPILIPNSNRIQAIEIYSKLILINCYFPCDTQDNSFINRHYESSTCYLSVARDVYKPNPNRLM